MFVFLHVLLQVYVCPLSTWALAYSLIVKQYSLSNHNWVYKLGFSISHSRGWGAESLNINLGNSTPQMFVNRWTLLQKVQHLHNWGIFMKIFSVSNKLTWSLSLDQFLISEVENVWSGLADEMKTIFQQIRMKIFRNKCYLFCNMIWRHYACCF